jgi:hypothetical protein
VAIKAVDGTVVITPQKPQREDRGIRLARLVEELKLHGPLEATAVAYEKQTGGVFR